MPSLKPNRLRGVAWPVLVDDVRPNPSCDQRTLTTPGAEPDQVADGVHGDLRIVGAGLDAQIAAADRRVELVARERGQLGQRRGTPGGEAEAVRAVGVVNRVRPEPDGQRQAGRRAGRWPRRCRPAARTARRRRRRPGRRPSPRSSGGRPPSTAFSIATSSSRLSVVTSKATKCSRSCAGVTIPAWCAPLNGTRRRCAEPAAAAVSRVAARRSPRRPPRRQHAGGTGAEQPEQPAAGQPAGRGPRPARSLIGRRRRPRPG